MYIAMNRFRIKRGEEATFEQIWAERDTYLSEVPGFKSFQLLKGAQEDDHTLYASHSVWESYQAFVNWTHSDEFKMAHAQAGSRKDIYLGPPKFEGFEAVMEQGQSYHF